MIELALTFWIAIVANLIIIAFGSLHYRINQDTDIFYSALLVIGVLVTVGSGVGWIITRGG